MIHPAFYPTQRPNFGKMKISILLHLVILLIMTGCKTAEPDLPKLSDSPPSIMSPQTLTVGELHNYVLEYLVEDHGLVLEQSGLSINIIPFIIPPVKQTAEIKKWREMWSTKLDDDAPRVFILELSETSEEYQYSAIEIKPNTEIKFAPEND